MIVRILAKPGSRNEGVEARSDGVLVVRVRERATDGRANEAIRKVLADTYGCRPRDVRIRAGLSSRHKTIELPG